MKKYDNFASHLQILSKASDEDLMNEFIISGIIGKFFIQFELGWKLLKDLLIYEGKAIGPRDRRAQLSRLYIAVMIFLMKIYGWTCLKIAMI